jgi:5'-3' exonuclease
MDEAAVVAKFGVSPASIPDYLALVGDAADGYPGPPGWGAKSAAAVLTKFHHLESIPRDASQWRLEILNTGSLARTLAEEWEHALLFRDLATLRTNISLFDNVDELCWPGPRPGFDHDREAGGCRRHRPILQKEPALC